MAQRCLGIGYAESASNRKSGSVKPLSQHTVRCSSGSVGGMTGVRFRRSASVCNWKHLSRWHGYGG